MLEGAGSGVMYFIYPRLEKLLEPEVGLCCRLISKVFCN